MTDAVTTGKGITTRTTTASASSMSTESWNDYLATLLEHDSGQQQQQPDAISLLTHESTIAQNPYSVTHWSLYLDDLDDLILQQQQQQQQPSSSTGTRQKSIHNVQQTINKYLRVRDWVGRRAVQHLPRSYKLWKRQWEFVLKQYHLHQNQSSNSSSNSVPSPKQVVACFEQAVVTLSAFPRVWMVYLQFLLEYCTMQQQQQQQQEQPFAEIKDPDSILLMISPTFVRRTINRALQALPVTQHEDKLWKPVLLPALLEVSSSSSATKVASLNSNSLQLFPVQSRACLLQRYATFQPAFAVEYGQWCEQHGLKGKAAAAYQSLLANNCSSSSSSTSDDKQQELWQAFGNLCSQHSETVESIGIRWEAVLRTALVAAAAQTSQHKHEQHAAQMVQLHQDDENAPVLLQGMIYSWLANAWVRRGAFDLARSVYEEGLTKVTTVRDFSLLYEAYLALEEGLLEHAVHAMEENETDHDDANNEQQEQQEQEQDTKDDWDILLETTATSPLTDMELAMARAEHLTRRRPLLLNAVLLRQNPHNVQEWLRRAELYQSQNQPGQAASTLEESLQKTVFVANHGNRSELVINLCAICTDDLQDVERARRLLDRVCNSDLSAEPVPMSKADDLAACWATWIELELRHEQWDQALRLARQSVAPNTASTTQAILNKTKHRRVPNLTKNLRLWDLLLDLEESLGTVQTTKDAYNRALEIKAATVQHVLNFASFLTEHNYFEESFTAYERGIELFAFPHPGAKLLWKAYLKAFVDRYKGNKVERTRDLFQRCLEHCPAEECAEFYMMNGAFEEEHGLTKRALSVYHAMCQKVPAKEKLTAYQLYVVKVTKYLGVTATRDIYQEAIENLEDQSAAKMCIEFAQMEQGLQEAERARAILTYGAQMADPRRLPEFWKVWNDFEIANGNEETFREMLRVKRSVEAAFSTVNYNATGMMEKVDTISQEEAIKRIASQEGVELEEAPKKAVVAGFVAGKRTAVAADLDDVEERVAKLRKATGVEGAGDSGANDEEIDIDDIDAEIEEAAAEGAAHTVEDVSTRAVPAAVFGGLAHEANKATAISEEKGALERIRSAKAGT